MATVLVVEDDPGPRDILCSVLELRQHTCIRAKDGIEGLERLAQHEVDVIYTNLGMPRMDGVGFLAHLDPALRRRVPCILGSGDFHGGGYWKTLLRHRLVDRVTYPVGIQPLMACLDWAAHLARCFRREPLDLDGTDVAHVCRLVREAHWGAPEHPYFGRAARAAYADSDLPVLWAASAWAARALPQPG